jgi:hypothetical protein
MSDEITIRLISSAEYFADGSQKFNGIHYGDCARCGATVIKMKHYVTGSMVEIDPLPVSDGNIVPDFINGIWSMVRKPQRGLWQAHVSSCPTFQEATK